MAMKFDHEGKTYYISFYYERRDVTPPSEGKTVKSEKPYTTATVYTRDEAGVPSIVARATVGCWRKDTFTREDGRLFALRLLTSNLGSKSNTEFKRAMWNAYINRSR